LAIALQAAVNAAGQRPGDAVKYGRLRVGHDELDSFAGTHAKALPVDDGALAGLLDGGELTRLRDVGQTSGHLPAGWSRPQRVAPGHADRQRGARNGAQTQAGGAVKGARAGAGDAFAAAPGVLAHHNVLAQGFAENDLVEVGVHGGGSYSKYLT